MERFNVEGAEVNVVHEQPVKGAFRSGKEIVLLHGNPSWSFIWRNVIDQLVGSGHEVYALDWIGHGASDKVSAPHLITFELHIKTLMVLIESYHLKECYVIAHDWGGCIALCTIPRLPAGTCSGVFLLNSFFPNRPSDVGIQFYLLYIIWFLSTGAFGINLSVEPMIRFMSPTVTKKVIAGYIAPFDTDSRTKSSVIRFAHIVPALPDSILEIRSTSTWRLVEGLLGPKNFTNFNSQARLAEIDRSVRLWWASNDEKNGKRLPRVAVVFGQDDLILKDLKSVLIRTIAEDVQIDFGIGNMIPHAGHFAMEEQPEAVTELVCQFVNTAATSVSNLL